jgi:hypothetical protein
MPSALIRSVRSKPAVLLAEQLAHQRYVHPGPLVLGTTLLKSPAPATDRDRTVSRRSKPSSRASLTGEQPDPWDLLQPQDETSRHRGAKHRRRYGLLGGMSLLSPGYLLSVGLGTSTCSRGITSPYFRTCFTCRCRSQAPLCACTRRLIADQAEGTFGRLRYSFGGHHPSETAQQTLFLIRITDLG